MRSIEEIRPEIGKVLQESDAAGQQYQQLHKKGRIR